MSGLSHSVCRQCQANSEANRRKFSHYQEISFKKYTNKVEILKVKTTNMGSMYELIYAVSMKINLKEKDFLDEIRCRNGNMLVSLERQELSEVEL